MNRQETIRAQTRIVLLYKQLEKLLFEELTVDSGKWTVKVSTAWILFKIIDEVDTSTVNCQLSTVHCESFK